MAETPTTAAELIADYDAHLASLSGLEGIEGSRSRNAIRAGFADELRNKLAEVAADLAAENRPELAAIVRGLRAIHRPIPVDVVAWECAQHDCAHEDT